MTSFVPKGVPADRQDPAYARLPSVAVIVLDTLRADMIDQPELLDSLPVLNQFFNESYVFSRAYAPSHWTIPTHASLFTGLSPTEHQAHPPDLKLRPDVPTIAEIFRNRGYETLCVTCNPWLSADFGLTRGFSSVLRPSPYILHLLGFAPQLRRLFARRASDRGTRSRRAKGGTSSSHGIRTGLRKLQRILFSLLVSSPRADNGARSAIRLTKRALNNGEGPTFLLLNLMEAHSPYYGRGRFSSWRRRLQFKEIFGRFLAWKLAVMSGRVPLTEATREGLREAYWENVRYLDAQLGHLLRVLPSRFLEEGYVVVVSDHGQLLGEQGAVDHMSGLNLGLLKVPLAIRPPGGTERQWVEEPIDTSEVFSFLREIAVGNPDPFPEWLTTVRSRRSVIGEAHGGYVPNVLGLVGRSPDAQEDLLAFRRVHDHPALTCIRGDWKLTCHLGRIDDELYRIAKDPVEEVNRVEEEQEKVASLHEELRTRLLAGPQRRGRAPRRDRLPLDTKREISELVLGRALREGKRPVLLWTGGKDSSLVLHLTQLVTEREGLTVPPVLFVDHGQHFPETRAFVQRTVDREGLRLLVATNSDLLNAAEGTASEVPLERLSEENQENALKAGLEGDTVPLDLNTAVGNHLLKTVALNQTLAEHQFDMAIAGIRWDEGAARADEVFFSPREEPPHTRVHPILTWTERDVWVYTLENGLPIHPLYKQGYRSLGGMQDSRPSDSRPAWEQDLEASEERAGRAQDKEKMMDRLRALGYF